MCAHLRHNSCLNTHFFHSGTACCSLLLILLQVSQGTHRHRGFLKNQLSRVSPYLINPPSLHTTDLLESDPVFRVAHKLSSFPQFPPIQDLCSLTNFKRQKGLQSRSPHPGAPKGLLIEPPWSPTSSPCRLQIHFYSVVLCVQGPLGPVAVQHIRMLTPMRKIINIDLIRVGM